MRTDELENYIVNFILKPNPLPHNIVGAPFNIGDEVQILNNPYEDSTFDEIYFDKKGQVIFFEYECGCGQTFPADPMIGVRINEDLVGEFWKEELRLLR